MDTAESLDPTLWVLDHGNPIGFSFADLVKYHGRASIGGVALGFKAMQQALPLLGDGNPVERYDIDIETEFGGPGTRDAFELVTRAVTGDRYTVNLDMGAEGAPDAPQGRFFFRFGCHQVTVDLTLRAGLVSEEFNQLVRKGPDTPDEETLLIRLKEDLATRLMALPAEQVYDAVVVT